MKTLILRIALAASLFAWVADASAQGLRHSGIRAVNDDAPVCERIARCPSRPRPVVEPSREDAIRADVMIVHESPYSPGAMARGKYSPSSSPTR